MLLLWENLRKFYANFLLYIALTIYNYFLVTKTTVKIDKAFKSISLFANRKPFYHSCHRRMRLRLMRHRLSA